MLISKKLFHHSPNSYLLIITVAIMLLGIAGCEGGCGTTSEESPRATDLDVKFTLEKRTAVLEFFTTGGNNEVARLTDFDMEVKMEAVGKNIGDSSVKYVRYNPDTRQASPQEVKLNPGKRIDIIKRASLYEFFDAGRGGSFEYKQNKKNELKFEIIPDMSKEIESITITVTVFSNLVGADGKKWQQAVHVTWKRSSYELKIIGLKNGVIENNTCTLQVTSKNSESPITPDDLDGFEVEIKQDNNDVTGPQFNEEKEESGRKIITFDRDELQPDGKIEKKLTVNPGTRQEKTMFTFALYSPDSESKNEADAVAMVTYQPAIRPYSLEVTKDKLVGSTEKEFTVTIKDQKGTPIEEEKLKKMKLKIKRIIGANAVITEATGGTAPDFEFTFDGSELHGAQADKKFTINMGADTKAAFKYVLVDDEGKIVADQQLDIQWEIGVEATIKYNNKNEDFECELHNNTSQDVKKVKLTWEGLEGTDVTVGAHKDKEVDILAKNKRKEVLKVHWKGKSTARFRFTVTTVDGVMVYQQDHSIARHAPHLSISLENAKDPFKVGDTVQLKIKADGDVDEEGLKIAKFIYKSSNNAELTINTQNVQGKNVQELLKLAGKGDVAVLNKKAEHTIDITISPQEEGLSSGSFTELNLEGSYRDEKKPYGINIVRWVGKVEMSMQPADPAMVTNGALIANGQKEFNIVFTNNSKFSLDEARLKELEFSIVISNPSVEPDKVLYKNLELKTTKVTLWDVMQAMGKNQFNQGESEKIKIPFIIDSGTQRLVEFKIRLEGSGNSIGVVGEQAVKWESLSNKLVIITPSPIKVTPQSSQTELENFSFEVRNDGSDLSEEDLKKIVVDFLQHANESRRAQFSTRRMGKRGRETAYRTISFADFGDSVKNKVSRYEELLSSNAGQVTLYSLLQLNGGNVTEIKKGDKVIVPMNAIPISSSGASGKKKPISVRLCLKDSITQEIITEVNIQEESKS